MTEKKIEQKFTLLVSSMGSLHQSIFMAFAVSFIADLYLDEIISIFVIVAARVLDNDKNRRIYQQKKLFNYYAILGNLIKITLQQVFWVDYPQMLTVSVLPNCI